MGSVEVPKSDDPPESDNANSIVPVELAGGSEGAGEGTSSASENLCYQPITTLEELLSYGATGSNQCHLVSEVCKKKTIPLLDNSFSKTKIGFNGKHLNGDAEGRYPMTLVCHDLKGGYGDDK